MPSSSLTAKTGIPPDVPAGAVALTVLAAIGVGAQPKTPADGKSNVNLLWGIVVPTTSVDRFINTLAAAGVPTTPAMVYGATLAHEVGHVLGLRHRIPRA